MQGILLGIQWHPPARAGQVETVTVLYWAVTVSARKLRIKYSMEDILSYPYTKTP